MKVSTALLAGCLASSTIFSASAASLSSLPVEAQAALQLVCKSHPAHCDEVKFLTIDDFEASERGAGHMIDWSRPDETKIVAGLTALAVKLDTDPNLAATVRAALTKSRGPEASVSFRATSTS